MCVHVCTCALTSAPTRPPVQSFSKSFVGLQQTAKLNHFWNINFFFPLLRSTLLLLLPEMSLPVGQPRVSLPQDLETMLRSPWLPSARSNDGCCKFLTRLAPCGCLGSREIKGLRWWRLPQRPAAYFSGSLCCTSHYKLIKEKFGTRWSNFRCHCIITVECGALGKPVYFPLWPRNTYSWVGAVWGSNKNATMFPLLLRINSWSSSLLIDFDQV